MKSLRALGGMPSRGQPRPRHGALRCKHAHPTLRVVRACHLLAEFFPAAILAFVIALTAAAAFGQTSGREQTGPDASLYTFRRPPLARSLLARLPIGSITPRGWLRHQLELEAAGQLGHLQEISKFLKWEGNGWIDPQGTSGWEELPYWLKGYGDLGYVLGDQKIIAQARRWIDGILAAQQEDGWFGPVGLKTAFKEKAPPAKPDMWPHMPILNALQSYYEYSGDRRVLQFMTRYFQWQNRPPPGDFGAGYWPRMRFGDNLESVYWLYDRTGDAWLLDLARKIHENMADWSTGVPNWHNVNIAQCFREPTEYWLQAQKPELRAAAERNYQEVMQLYGQFPGGGFAGDENCRKGFGDPHQGFETCGIVEFMHSFHLLNRITNDPRWADRCEEIALNSLPAALTPDLKALHYLTCANQVQLDRGNKAPGIQNRGMMFSYSPHGYRCCQHNHGMGWPYHAEELWLATANGGLYAPFYAACEVRAKVADGVEVRIVEETDYPFGDTVRLRLSLPHPARFPLGFRTPAWCQGATIDVNGQVQPPPTKAGWETFLGRLWSDGDVATLHLPMRVVVRTWEKNHGAVSVDYGPLTFSLRIDEKWGRSGGTDAWPDWEVFPASPWNYGLVLDPKDPARSFEVVRKPGPIAAQPFTHQGAPIELRVKAKKIPGWQLDRNGLVAALQQSPIRSGEPEETVTLIPMGAARLRITAFPVIGGGPDAHDWAAEPKPPILASASHCHSGDSVTAMFEKREPKDSNDHGVPRFTWWPNRGSLEWVQYDFDRPRTLSAATVYWFDDTGQGHCRVPQSWRLLAKQGDAWKPIENAEDFGVKKDTYNRVSFKPVTTTGLRIEAKLQPGYSGGVLQWRLEK